MLLAKKSSLHPLSLQRRMESPSLGVLSLHLEGERCRVGCEFCYLGQRLGPAAEPLPTSLLQDILLRLDYEEVAVAVSEPAGAVREPLFAIAQAVASRGRTLTLTTTARVLADEPRLLEGVQRVNLSIDPRKGAVTTDSIGTAARRIKPRELVLIVSLVSPEWAERLLAGELHQLLALPEVDRLVLNGLKPPPPWCNRNFWLGAVARLAPLLDRELNRRLFLDCYVAARIFRLGGCPARPDISPGPEFRSCVYQPTADFRFATAPELAARLTGFVPPAECPFPID